MVLTIEISQLQFDKVVFVPVVQNVQFILLSTSLPWCRGWFSWSCMSKTIEIPPVAVLLVVDVPVMLWLQVPQVRMVPPVQFSVEVPQLVPHLAFWAVYTGTRPGLPLPSGRGRGGGDAGSLLPGVLPPN